MVVNLRGLGESMGPTKVTMPCDSDLSTLVCLCRTLYSQKKPTKVDKQGRYFQLIISSMGFNFT